MSTRLDELITAARESDEFSRSWDGERAVRVREGALHRRDVRVRRDRALRRGLLVASGAGLLVLALLRAASSAPRDAAEPVVASSSTTTVLPVPAPTAEALASRTLADAGYARD